MKIFTVIAVVCYLFVATYSLPTIPASPPTSDPIQKCSDENQVPIGKARKLVRHDEQASNEKEKCFLSCYLKARDYFVNGKVDFDKLLQFHKNFVPVSQHERLEKTFKECERNMDYTKNDCEVAYQVYQCAKGEQT